MVLSFIGACLLWVGWFGFNAGSALAAGPLATSAFINTHFAAAAAALGWTIAEWIHNGKPTALGAISGAVAGLVAITPGLGIRPALSRAAIGFVAGLFCSFMVFKVKKLLRLRRLSRRLWRPRSRRNPGRPAHRPLRHQGYQRSLRQGRRPPAPSTDTGASCSTRLAGVGIAWSISIVGTLVLLFVVDKVIGLRVSPDRRKYWP